MNPSTRKTALGMYPLSSSMDRNRKRKAMFGTKERTLPNSGNNAVTEHREKPAVEAGNVKTP